jgi:hypothetical protein
MAIPGPFPEKHTKDSLVENRLLFDWLKPLNENPLYRGSNFAVMYLSAGRGSYAGWNLDKSRYSGSVLKIAVLYAAFQLRENAKLAAQGMKKEVVLRNIEATWKPIVQQAVPGPANFPKLAEIFVPDTGTVEFRDDFHDDLKLMASASDTKASGRVITKLGHQYVNGVLEKQDLFSKKEKGLWVGGNYNDIEWHPEPAAKSHYAATPRALLRFLNLLSNNTLISADISKKMKGMMDNFYSERLWTATQYDNKNSFGKLGWEYMKDGKTKELFDAGVIARTTSRGNYNYGLIIQGLPTADFSSLAVELDKIMYRWHP